VWVTPKWSTTTIGVIRAFVILPPIGQKTRHHKKPPTIPYPLNKKILRTPRARALYICINTHFCTNFNLTFLDNNKKKTFFVFFLRGKCELADFWNWFILFQYLLIGLIGNSEKDRELQNYDREYSTLKKFYIWKRNFQEIGNIIIIGLLT